MFPDRRAIVTNGVYRWLRHPMYAYYLLLDLIFWLADPQPWFGLVWVVEVLLLEARTHRYYTRIFCVSNISSECPGG